MNAILRTGRPVERVLDDILAGASAQRATGFMLHLPPGFSMDGAIDTALARTYGGLAHPDLRILEPAGAAGIIAVDAVRGLLDFLAAAPGGDGFKTLLIRPADRMNEAASNALLKSLEEPTRATRIVLVTDVPAALPPTVLSRCLRIPVAAEPGAARHELLGRLAAREDADPAPAMRDVDAALALAGGNPRDAAAILVHGLPAWALEVARWLSAARPDSGPPMPQLSGKSAAPIEVCAAVLHTLLHGALLECAGIDPDLPARIEGWSESRLLAAAADLTAALTDIRRPGLDARLRLHRLLAGLIAT